MKLNRVVVTGLGVVCPIGNDVDTAWENLLAGQSGIDYITHFDAENHPTKIAGEVKDFDDSKYIDKKAARRLELFTRFANSATMMALEDAGLEMTEEIKARTETIIGVGLGGLGILEANHEKLLKSGVKRVSPFMVPAMIANMASGQVSMSTGATGPNYCVTSACASGLHSIGVGFTDLLLGRMDVAICGGSESTITPLGVGGFNALKALSTRNDDPKTASRPFEKNRDGFVMGEGAGILILETLDHAKARGAKIYAEVVGFGASSDAFHMTSPPEDGRGMAQAMEMAMSDAGVAPEAIDHINAHGTSTYLNDLCESRAMKKVFGDHARNIAISGNKSMIGHLLGAAGAVESVFTIKSIANSKVPGTINNIEADPECDLDYTTNGSIDKDITYALCNSFGFGGTNCSMLYKKFED